MTNALRNQGGRLAPMFVLTVILGACQGEDGVGPSGRPASVAIDPASIELRIGESLGLNALYQDDRGRRLTSPSGWTVVWSSSDSAIVAVGQDGTIEGLRVGTALVKLTAGPLSAQVPATVLGPVSLTEPAARVSATVDGSGGSITTSTPDGTSYTLSIPAGALQAPVEITLTPLTGIDNLPLNGGLAAGLQFQPDGLQFLFPAELTVVTPTPVEAAGLVGFVVSGDEFHLIPVGLHEDTLAMMVGHFSGAGAGTGDADQLQDLASLPASNAEQAALQDLGAYIAASAAAGTEVDPARTAAILATWFESSVRPHLEAAGSDPSQLEAALAELNRWEGMVAAWASGQLEAQKAAGRALAVAALRNQIDRLNQKCSTENDWKPISEILQWVSVAELWGLTTDDNGLQIDDVIANLCLQVKILEADLPQTIGASGAAQLKVQAGISIGGRPAVFDPPLDIVTDGNLTALVTPPKGTTDGNGKFTADVSLLPDASDAKVDVAAQWHELHAIYASKRVTAEGAISLTLMGRPGGTNDPPSKQVEIDAGKDAELDITLLKGRAGYGGRTVTLRLDGPGSLSKYSAAVDSKNGQDFVWYTAPDQGAGNAIITAIIVDDGVTYSDQVRVHFGTGSPQEVYSNDFTVGAGSEWSPADVAQSPSGERFLGVPYGADSVSLTLTDLPAHDSVAIELDLYIIGSWNGSDDGNDGVDFLLDGERLLYATFSNNYGDGQSYPGTYPDSDYDPGTGASARGTLRYPIHDDDIWEDTTYRLTFAVPHTAGSVVLRLRGTQNDVDEWFGIDNVVVRIR